MNSQSASLVPGANSLPRTTTKPTTQPTSQLAAQTPLAWTAGVSFGVITQLIFFVTAYRLFFFLRDPQPNHGAMNVWINIALAFVFAVPHSLLLWPKTQSWIKRYLPAPFYGSLFCLATCLSLQAIFAFWSSSPTIVWQTSGTSRILMLTGYYGSWVALIYSIRLTGLGYQTGWTPWFNWLLGRKEPRREFVSKGAYRYLRHPVYLSFLGLLWFVPTMSLDHAILTGIWTAYIFLGSYFKDRRLTHYLGDIYRKYQSEVSGYPFIPFGPLAKRTASDDQ